jgi:pimeloyl-ACP methyl ester carboxylesterase
MKKPVRKYRWFRRLLRVKTVSLLLFIIACLVFDRYVQFRRSDDELRKIFAERGIDGRIGYYQSGGRKLRYTSVGPDSLPTLLLLHGSPGSMSYYAGRYADSAIYSRFQVLAVDRPGYGYSGLGDPEPSVQRQAAMIRPLIDSLHRADKTVIIAGGSFGAAVACRIAMDYPDLVDGLVLTGPAIGPGREAYFWFTPVVESPLVRWFIPRIFRSANTEKVHHREELEAMLPLWKNIEVPVAFLQGENDDIVDTSNASFARKHLVNAPYLKIEMIKDRGHRLAQFEWPRIRQAILDVYEKATYLPPVSLAMQSE